ncbi:Fungalysin metallopeptidase-domain-containing protein [Globomyces pollinis-pini]|nr:Fungalysin metallopeptidase-domain-containing protein [Globomyces pollinis-pini]
MNYKYLSAITFALAAPTTVEKYDIPAVKRGDVELPFYYPEPITKSFPVSHLSARAGLSNDDLIKIAKAALVKEYGIVESELQIVQLHTGVTSGITHVYAVRTINGVPVDNNNCDVHIKNGQVIQIASSFSGHLQKRANDITPPKAVVSLTEVVKKATKEFNASQDEVPPKMVYIQTPSDKFAYSYQFQVKDLTKGKFLQVTVDAATGQNLQVVDYIAEASYKVIPFTKKDPRDGFAVLTNPENKVASPFGWHKDNTQSFTTTRGNNAISTVGGRLVSGGANLDFNTAANPNADPGVAANQRAAVVNAFYLVNSIHDITYQYGFTEAAGNFQNFNFGKGGAGNDAVIIRNQAPGENNANFATPPDGQPGVMNMFRFTLTNPNRDGSLDNGIPIHEYVHGVSNRLTGGSRQGNCLQATQSRGMGEGWSDTVAMFLARKETDTRATDFGMGSFAVNKNSGIRTFPYSTNLRTNPLTFQDINRVRGPHAMGEIWASMLNEVYWNLVEKKGFSSNWFDATQQKGNIIAMQLVIAGMKLQPCNPTFINARDAILKADDAFYKGANKCEIIKGFAKRGLGTNASANGRNGNAIPAECN